jgi:hypothetical protein
MKELSENLKPGNVALFVLIHEITVDRLLGGIQDAGGTVLKTSLDDSKERALREALAKATAAEPGVQSAFNDAAIDPFAIAEEVVRSLIPGKFPRCLTCNPFGGGICCDVDPDEVSSVEPDNEEGIEPVEIESWNNEQVHDGNVRRVVTQEGWPSLAGRSPPFDHVLGDAGLRDLNAELEQFIMDTPRAHSGSLTLIRLC